MLQPQKRNRTQLSCTNCRQSKLKCDRKEPCSQCTKRALQCVFPLPAPRKPPVSMKNRLRHLESLVKDAMAGQPPLAASSASANSHPVNGQLSSPGESPHSGVAIKGDVSNPSGQVVLEAGESQYVGSTHWAAILEDIEDIQTYFHDGDDGDDMDSDSTMFTSLAFKVGSSKSKLDILASFPKKLTVDRFVFQYFNSNSPSKQLIHRPTFQKQYRLFWENPQGMPGSFLALLYSLMLLGAASAIYGPQDGPENGVSTIKLVQDYRESCIECLVLSNYTRPGPFTIETIVIYLEAEFITGSQDHVHLYLLVGNIVRLALRMGLHRDSSKIGGHIPPFQAEMRRRTWHHIAQVDFLASFHIGLPGMIHAIESDTLLPRNLNDEDFSEDCLELPPSRPESEFTPMLYIICKGRLCNEAAKIAALANSLTLPAYSKLIQHDHLLHEAYEKVPLFFKLGDSGPSITDSPDRIIKSISLTLVFEKSRCMLHRRFLMKVKENPEFIFSRDAALDASINVLHCQSMAYEAALPGGPLSHNPWFFPTLSKHDFLLAAMIVYLSVIQAIEDSYMSTEERKEKIQVLEMSRKIWAETRIILPEAKRAATVLGVMLEKIGLALGQDSLPQKASPADNSDAFQASMNTAMGLPPHTDIPQNKLSIGTAPRASWPSTSENPPSSGLSGAFNFNPARVNLEPLNAMFDMPNDIDWEIFDNQVRPQQHLDQGWPELDQDFTMGDDYYPEI